MASDGCQAIGGLAALSLLSHTLHFGRLLIHFASSNVKCTDAADIINNNTVDIVNNNNINKGQSFGSALLMSLSRRQLGASSGSQRLLSMGPDC